MIIDAPALRHIPALRSLWQEAFGDTDAFLDGFFSQKFHCRCVLAENSPVAVLYWFDCRWEDKPLAYLYAVATKKSHRGKGLCRRLMEDTHTYLQRLGYAGCILVPGSMDLFRLYEKLGYSLCACVSEYEATAAHSSIPLEQLTPEQYAQRRRALLPAGAVLQEGSMLELLSTYARFYAGENCLLVCFPEKDILIIPEFLGDIETAPGILAALGYAKGQIRTPGSEKPFAMYRSLTTNPTAPRYFGLAMD